MTGVENLEQLRVRTAKSLAESFNSAGIRYVIINGLYGYPSGIGRDVDLLIRPEDVARAIACAEEIQARLGWDSLLLRWSPFDTWQLFFLRKGPAHLAWLEVDPMLKGTMVLGAASLLGEFGKTSELVVDYCRGPFPVSRVGHYVKSQLRPILYGDLARFKHKYALEAVEDKDIVCYLRGLLGKSMADRYLKATHAGVEGVSGLGKKLKWTINSRFAFRYPLRAIRNVIWSRFVRPIKLYLFTAGMVFQVNGPEIVNKAEILEEAKEYLNGCFEVRIKQRLIDPVKGEDSPAGQGRGWLGHWLRVAYQCGSLTWRYYLEDRFLPKSVIQFILYGSGTADVAMNPVKYGFRSAAGLKWMHAFIPRPMEIVLLPESPDQVGATDRKEDLASCSAQLDWWRPCGYNSQARNVVTAGDSVTESGRRLALCIVQEIEARFSVAQCKKLRRA